MSNEIDGSMKECPYITGVQCNQRDRMCGTGKFEANCVMLALRGIDRGVNANHDYLINEGILRACHVMLNKGFLNNKYNEYSSLKLKEEVMRILEEAKDAGREWHDVGWEFLGGSR